MFSDITMKICIISQSFHHDVASILPTFTNSDGRYNDTKSVKCTDYLVTINNIKYLQYFLY